MSSGDGTTASSTRVKAALAVDGVGVIGGCGRGIWKSKATGKLPHVVDGVVVGGSSNHGDDEVWEETVVFYFDPHCGGKKKKKKQCIEEVNQQAKCGCFVREIAEENDMLKHEVAELKAMILKIKGEKKLRRQMHIAEIRGRDRREIGFLLVLVACIAYAQGATVFPFLTTSATARTGAILIHCRLMEFKVYLRRSVQEREEAAKFAAARGLQQLGEGVVYSSVMALPAPTSPPRPGMPVMHELPRRVDGMHPRLVALEAMQEGRYQIGSEYVLPKMVPPRLVPEISDAGSLCRIKKTITDWINRKICMRKYIELPSACHS